MAEAVVDGTPMPRFFCHECNVEIDRLQPDYTCPRCKSGFIEELEGGSTDNGSGMDGPRDMVQTLLGFIDHVPQTVLTSVGNRSNAPNVRRRANWTRSTHEPRHHASNRGRQEGSPPIENFIQDLFLNLSGTRIGYPPAQDAPPVFNIRLFLGNPGDYVWGRDGLDTIVTQLLNQMDGTGPPPLPRKQIDEIPTTTVSQSQVDCKLQCSVCWEDFKLSEPVRQLPCQHFYHAPCIVPWLELHGTCPICRQSLGDQNSAEAIEDTVGSSLAALFRVANESNSSRTSSTSSTGSHSSSNASNEY